MEHAGLARPPDHHCRCLVGFDELYGDRFGAGDLANQLSNFGRGIARSGSQPQSQCETLVRALRGDLGLAGLSGQKVPPSVHITLHTHGFIRCTERPATVRIGLTARTGRHQVALPVTCSRLMRVQAQS